MHTVPLSLPLTLVYERDPRVLLSCYSSAIYIGVIFLALLPFFQILPLMRGILRLSLLLVLQLTYFFVIFITFLAVVFKASHQASLSPCLLLVDAKDRWFFQLIYFLATFLKASYQASLLLVDAKDPCALIGGKSHCRLLPCRGWEILEGCSNRLLN